MKRKDKNCVDCDVVIENAHPNTLYCPNCRVIRNRMKHKKWADKNKEAELERNRKYKRENREKVNARKKIARLNNHEHYLEVARKKYYRNHEKHLEWNRENYRKHKEKRRAKAREYHIKNAEVIRQKVKEWTINNPEKVKAYSHLKRARKLNAIGEYTPDEFTSTCEEFSWCCCYCGKSVTEKTVTIDHAVPISKGGSNYIENLLPACRKCNSSKNASELFDWFKNMEFYDIAREKKIIEHISKNNQLALF